MKRVLVLSDSHSTMFFMRSCVRAVKPDAIIHLGDHFDDGAQLGEENPHIRLHQVPGNCDHYRMLRPHPEILRYPVYDVPMYITHGHKHNVKQTLALLLADARADGAAAVLYGHTHKADCHREADGLWVLNPGSCGYGGGTAGLLEICDGRIESCRLLQQKDLEEFE